METNRKIAKELSREISKPVYMISAVSGSNVKELIKAASDLLDKENEEELSYLSLPTDNETIGKKGLTF